MKPRAEAAVLVQPEVEARVPPFKAVSRKGVLAIAAVIDVAINASARPLRDGILKGIRGPHGGYALARESNRITADDILRAARTAEDELPLPGSTLVHDVVRPALAETERTVSVALGRINIDDMVKRAKTLR